jgi:Aminomethyltransferase folate-binding domain
VEYNKYKDMMMFTNNKSALVQMGRRCFSSATNTAQLKRTHLYSFHKDNLKAKMVPFAGYDMPVTYPEGIIKEHLACRESVGLFDVSHMG